MATTYPTVGTLAPGEAFVNYTTNKWSVQPGSVTIDVYSSPQIFIDNNVSYVEVGILHNGTFPVNGYIAATSSLAVIDYCFYTMNNIWHPTFPDQKYYVFETQKSLSVYDQFGNFSWTMSAGTMICTDTGAPGDTYKNLMILYGYEQNSQWWAAINNVNYGFIDTGIEQGSGCTTWGLKLNRSC
ncbi:hypothetical protein JI721_06900 [Alicyclobacillus cycloheptanicus]|uniref:Uncharacterized protein n=1 Tax=Alicyclobacillus cycloheptanicus TaxID=1457 RepID=A0ABT9XHN8_9BACL|nr:hypothetical protein [Alicyclobacillus cycloheptanicus]MDQ0189816.1 hypothetical protein [Alicyclobacillus cycloheptanicus]WDM02495.1 hypothetical protein JI721_06900 [Alicyclobacillus cycloheptanicus]